MDTNRPIRATVGKARVLLKVLFFGLALCLASLVHAQPEILLFDVGAANRPAQAPDGFTSVSINTSGLFALATLSKASLTLPGKPSVPVIHDRVETHPSGNKTWIGYLEDFGTSFRVLITTGPDGTSGRIAMPGTEYLVNSQDGKTWLVDTKTSGMTLAIARGNDAIVPPAEARAMAAAKASQAPVSASAAPTPQSTVDVMVVYTPSLVAQLGSGLQTRLDHLVAIANQAYIDSEVAIKIRLVHSTQVAYSDTTDSNVALDDISGLNGNSIPSSLASVAAWRNTYGADLVVLMRAFNHSIQSGCGVAWVGGIDSGTLVGSDHTGYAVVSNGNSGSFFCDEFTFAHELGHNMGNMHDRRTDPVSTSGVFNYSFGHGVDNAFSTVMAYPSSFTNGPTIGKFSNPQIDCKGRPCGVSGSTNNALSMNNVRSQVANYRATTVTGSSTLTVSKTGTGSGTVTSGDGTINCGSTCAASYPTSTVVSLTAIPAQNSSFGGWTDACIGVGACSVTMGAGQRVVATFNLRPTVLDVPGAPGIGAAVAGNMSASVAFTPPTSDGGASIDLYRATCTGGIYATSTVSPIVVAGLSNGGNYVCTVAAHNSQGWGPESAISDMVTPGSTVDQTVVALNLTNLSGSSGSSQFYSFVVPSGASSLLVQTIGVGSGDVDLYVRAGSQPTASVYDCSSENYGNNELCLTPSPSVGTYFVELFAYESYSGVSLLISYRSNVSANPPGAPTIIAATGGLESASVAFSAPASNGGAPIDIYRVSCGGISGTGASSPIVVSGLTNGVGYTCTVAAHNSVGWGPESDPSNLVTPSNTNTSAKPPRLLNIATRGRVETVDNVMIAGFIIQGSSPKKVLIRARGPSLAAAPFNVPGTLSDPFLTLYSGATPIDSNDDFAQHANAAQIPADWIPANAKEAAIVTTLNPGAYTAIVNGVAATSGVAIVEVFEIDQPDTPLINIATRGPVYTGDNVMIAGLIIQGDAPKTVLITARGPSMAGPPHNVPGTLANPTLSLFSGQTVIATNDNWTEAANAAQIQTAIGAPSNTLESAILVTLQPGAYTAIVSGAGGGTGLAIVEVFAQ